jgi:hypothetical protein
MISLLFWNLNNKALIKSVTNLVLKNQIDILMLVECPIEPVDLLNSLNSEGDPEYFFAPGHCERIHIYTKFSDRYIKPIFEHDRLTIRHLKLPARMDILLAITHFPSKREWSGDSQSHECFNLAKDIKTAENSIGHSRTILVGDLNMNPFETGMVSANGLHAVMSKAIARKRCRTVQQQQYPFFYNPMWSLLGDSTIGPPGTCYFPRSEHITYFWYMFDQVLIRPDLLELFRNEDLRILESDGEATLISKKGYPKSKEFSDHLPIFFKLEI